MSQLSMILDKLEMADILKLQNVVPSYYRMIHDTRVSANDRTIISELKAQLRFCLDEKYLLRI